MCKPSVISSPVDLVPSSVAVMLLWALYQHWSYGNSVSVVHKGYLVQVQVIHRKFLKSVLMSKKKDNI